MCSVATLFEAGHHPLVVVIDVLCFGFALLDESIALVSLGYVVIAYIGFWFFIFLRILGFATMLSLLYLVFFFRLGL